MIAAISLVIGFFAGCASSACFIFWRVSLMEGRIVNMVIRRNRALTKGEVEEGGKEL